eukprot:6146743-Karenia_brevis.AAC.1
MAAQQGRLAAQTKMATNIVQSNMLMYIHHLRALKTKWGEEGKPEEQFYASLPDHVTEYPRYVVSLLLDHECYHDLHAITELLREIKLLEPQ